MSLTLAAAQPHTVAGDLVANAAAHAAAIREAQAGLVVFPELSLTGYELDAEALGPEDEAIDPIAEACAEMGSVALAGAPVKAGGLAYIAMLRIDAGGAAVAYRKTFLGGREPERFSSGPGPAVMEEGGVRVGLGICKDTGVEQHVREVAALGVDVYAAGVTHLAEELEEQDRRGAAIARACGAHVALASFAGPTGGGFSRTAGHSTVWAPDGRVLARAGSRPGEIAQVEIP